MTTYPTDSAERAERAKSIRIARIAGRVALRAGTAFGYRVAAKAYDRAEACAGTTIANDLLRSREQAFYTLARMEAV